VDDDRTKLTTADLLRAKATLKYTRDIPTHTVMVDLDSREPPSWLRRSASEPSSSFFAGFPDWPLLRQPPPAIILPIL
jgi:hypothetical protein